MTGKAKDPSEATSLQDIADAIAIRFEGERRLERLATGQEIGLNQDFAIAVSEYVSALPENVAYSLIPVAPEASSRSDVNPALAIEVLLLLENMGFERLKKDR